uniref:contractile injection system tape measure protein n=1 Tax=uncultured Bacteroides sp. TaxID=162156 RepID=UPI0025D68893|nr:contractile injection system tape measure protein [uncultured Bacteroides sp.]
MEQNTNEEWKNAEAEDHQPENQGMEMEVDINNAGLCLISPFIPMLFRKLGYLENDNKHFKKDVERGTETKTKIRAIFVLQYSLSLEERQYCKQDLMLGRVFLNLPMDIVLPDRLELNDKEKQTVEEMLTAAKNNWDTMRNKSLAGFQEAFLKRSGRLKNEGDKWLLTVDERAYDILFQYLPWNFERIRFPWTDKLIAVKWDNRW